MFLEDHLSSRLAAGEKIFVPYLTAGLPDEGSFLDLVARISRSSDVIEIGIPFSDPIMDGPVIQDSSNRALAAGVTVDSSLEMIRRASKTSSCPLAVMTYFNLIHRMGLERAVERLREANVVGLIVPDLPFEEETGLTEVLTARDVAHIQMVAPATSPERSKRIAAASRGWLYAVARMGVTGEQATLAEAAHEVVQKVRPYTKVPVLLGIGISNAEQATQAAALADGVIVGSAIVRLVLEGNVDAAVALSEEIRRSLSAPTS